MIPDLAGFRAAQRTLRQELGVDVTFRIPVAPVWPVGTQIDPETGRPYDPTIEPQSGGNTTPVVKHGSLIFRPITTDDNVAENEPIGPRRDKMLALAIEVEDYAAIANASDVTVEDRDYKVREILRDPGLDDRYIVYAEAK